jgi:hypothetical protein
VTRVGPFTWRITSPDGKLAYLLLVTLVVPIAVEAASAALGSWAGMLVSVPLLLVAVGFAVRNFREPEIESLESPREWWRMTAAPTSGFVVGTAFLLQALWVALSASWRPDGWALMVGALTEGLLGAAFVRSSLRLRARAGGRAPDRETEHHG